MKTKRKVLEKSVVLILHNIRSAYNVGSIFRTADAAGVSKIYCTGYTPTPADRFGRTERKIQKTALGAEKLVSWERVAETKTILQKLKKEKFFIIGVEQSPRSVHFKSLKLKQKTALVFGNEVRGLPHSILKQCDIVAEIPMRGKKESLNVSVAAGIMLFRILNI